jgi:hypothetical protein
MGKKKLKKKKKTKTKEGVADLLGKIRVAEPLMWP